MGLYLQLIIGTDAGRALAVVPQPHGVIVARSRSAIAAPYSLQSVLRWPTGAIPNVAQTFLRSRPVVGTTSLRRLRDVAPLSGRYDFRMSRNAFCDVAAKSPRRRYDIASSSPRCRSVIGAPQSLQRLPVYACVSEQLQRLF